MIERTRVARTPDTAEPVDVSATATTCSANAGINEERSRDTRLSLIFNGNEGVRLIEVLNVSDEEAERMDRLIALMNQQRPNASTPIQGDSALLQNPADLGESEKWVSKCEICDI